MKTLNDKAAEIISEHFQSPGLKPHAANFAQGLLPDHDFLVSSGMGRDPFEMSLLMRMLTERLLQGKSLLPGLLYWKPFSLTRKGDKLILMRPGMAAVVMSATTIANE